MNAKTDEDVRFFYSLWINLNDINNFIETAIWIIFSIIVLLEILALVIFLFKFLFTKKEFKKKRIARWIISFFILIITFITVSSWMYIDKKIKALPNWQELAYWNIQILNNDLLKKSDKFNREAALITETTNLIWPMNIKFDLTNFAKNEKEKWIKINKYKWNFWWESEITTLEPTIIKKFNEKWAYKVTLTLEEVDLHWDIVEKVVENIPSIEIAYLVEVEEEKLDNWGKIVKFDASDLKDLWKIDWYFITDDNTDLKPVFTWYKFNPAKVIFEDTIIWFQIQTEDRKNDNLDKIFIVEAVKQNDIKGKIEIQQDPLDDLLYTFSVKDINSDFGNWFIEEFKWKIDNVKTKTLQSDIDNIEKSSTFKIKFKKYWKHIIKVDLKDSNWNIKTLEKEFEIKKNIKLKKILEFYNDNRPLENIEYKKSTHEYFIKNLKVPTTLEINAKNLESENILDYLEKIQWDIW
jgi:heme/copper-type cytochrome/quinol oxidase subunit 2